MQVRLLGPFDVVDGGRTLPLGGRRQRALLALLVLHANEVVASERIVEELWNGTPPPTATKIVQNYVSQLRKALGDGLVTRAGGYALELGPGDVDASRFEALLEEGRRRLAAGQAKSAAEILRDALALWYGPPLADFAYDSFAQSAIARLEELKLAALEERIEADLELGRHADLVPELEALVREHPLRERLRGQLMRALYRSGRQAEALDVFQAARRELVDELGIEPSQALRDLEKAILTQDPVLDARPPSGVARPPPSRRTWAVLAAVPAAAVVAAALLVVFLHEGSTSEVQPPNSVAAIDAGTNKVTTRVAVGSLPSAITTSPQGVWVMNAGDQTVSLLDSRTGHVGITRGVATVGSGLTAIAYGFNIVWIANGYLGTIARLYADGALPQPPIRVERGNGRDVFGLAIGADAVWVSSTWRPSVIRIDSATNRVLARIALKSRPVAIAIGERGVWFAGESGFLGRIDPRSNTVVAEIALPSPPSGVAVGFGSVWVSINERNAVWRIDPATNAVEQTIGVGDGPSVLAAGAGAVWVANARGHTISRIDPVANAVGATIRVADTPRAIAVGGGKVWIAGA
jgi:YVTN family beta-propeller protein